MTLPRISPPVALGLFALLLAVLAMLRPIDHDESQYVAAAVLARNGFPYRDFAYLQTPLQPILFAPLAALSGDFAWPALRLVNALLCALAIVLTYAGARRVGADQRIAIAAALLFAACDSLLFSAAMARNDALPTALLAGGLLLALGPVHTRLSAFGAGLCFAAAAAAKVSFALPAGAFGLYVLLHREHRPMFVALGALAPTLFVAWSYAQAPANFIFGVLDFPSNGLPEFYASQPFRLSAAMKLVDTLKFLALGPALLALVLVARHRGGGRDTRLLDVLILAGLIAAVLPSPVWRQYLMPVLPPLFVRLALLWRIAPPGRATKIAFAVFVAAGLAPSAGTLLGQRIAMDGAMNEGRAIRAAMDVARVTGAVATLSPQFLPMTGRLPDARFATGPFFWRSPAPLSPRDQAQRRVVAARSIDSLFAPGGTRQPAAVLVGGEGPWTSGDTRVDAGLEAWAIRSGWKRVQVASKHFRLYVPLIRSRAVPLPARASSRD